MSLPKISVVTVSYNHAEFLRQNIESVLAQNYPNFEHIIIDGGSTDSTVEILKSYPHLKWVSEADRGQTHALNKGFSRASGEIIAWLNSDDWYAPNIFHEVAEKLKDAPVLMGACQFVDKEGNFKELVENSGRNWFDILKYWIFYSSPAQPSIFFRKDLLEAVKRADGNYLDEDLHFCMDFELWLRMAFVTPFTNVSKSTFSYFRTYESNKTGADMDSTYREVIKVYRKYQSIAVQGGQNFSFIIPIESLNSAVLESVENLTHQELKDFEIILVHYGKSSEGVKALRKQVLDLDRKLGALSVRFIDSYSESFLEAVQRGIFASNSPYGAVIEPGTYVDKVFSIEAINLFLHAIVGLAFPSKGDVQIAPLVGKDNPNLSHGMLFNPDSIFTIPPYRSQFVYRKVALLELGGFKNGVSPLFAFRELLLRLIYKGWHISVDNKLCLIKGVANMACDRSIAKNKEPFITAKIITDLEEERVNDHFSDIRCKHGFSIELPKELIENAKNLLKQAPANWDMSEN